MRSQSGTLTADVGAREDSSPPPQIRVGPTRRLRNKRVLASILSVIVFVILVVAAQIILTAAHVSAYLVPTPLEVWHSLRQGFTPGPASFYGDVLITFEELLLGFGIAAVAGLLVGLFMAQWELLERVAYPYIFAFQAIPKIALAPLFVIWLGYGQTSKVGIAVVCAFFPMMVNSLAGFKTVETNHLTMFRALCASRTQTFLKLRLPSALPILLSGLDLALVYALLGAIVGEFVGGQKGLGVRILNYDQNIDVAGYFAVILVLCVMGMLLHTVLMFFRRKYLFWTPSEISRRSGAPVADQAA